MSTSTTDRLNQRLTQARLIYLHIGLMASPIYDSSFTNMTYSKLMLFAYSSQANYKQEVAWNNEQKIDPIICKNELMQK